MTLPCPPGFPRPLDKSPPGIRRSLYSGTPSARPVIPHFQSYQQSAAAASVPRTTGTIQSQSTPLGLAFSSSLNDPIKQWNTFANLVPYTARPPHPYGAIGDHLKPKRGVGNAKVAVKPQPALYNRVPTVSQMHPRRQVSSYPYLEAYQQQQSQPRVDSYPPLWLPSGVQWPQTRLQWQSDVQSQTPIYLNPAYQSQLPSQLPSQLQSQLPSQLQPQLLPQLQSQLQLQPQPHLESNEQPQQYQYLPSQVQAQKNSQPRSIQNIQLYQQFQPIQQPQSSQQLGVYQQLQFQPQTQVDFPLQSYQPYQFCHHTTAYPQPQVGREYSYTLVDDSGPSSGANSPIVPFAGDRVSLEEPASSRIRGTSMLDSPQPQRRSPAREERFSASSTVVPQTPAPSTPTPEPSRAPIRAPPGLPMPLPPYPSQINPYSVLPPPPGRPRGRPASTQLPHLVRPANCSASEWIKHENDINILNSKQPRAPLPFEGMNVPIALYPGHFVAEHKRLVDGLALLCGEMHRQRGLTRESFAHDDFFYLLVELNPSPITFRLLAEKKGYKELVRECALDLVFGMPQEHLQLLRTQRQ